MANEAAPYIFLDTCSLLVSCWNPKCNTRGQEIFIFSKEKADTFWNQEFCSLEAMGEIIIPARNYEELLKHSRNKNKKDLSERAQEITQRISKLYYEKRIQIIGDPNDPFADAILLSVALKFRTQKNMAFVTQDRKLARDLNTIRNFESVQPRNGCDIKIRRIKKDGTLGKHKFDQNEIKPSSKERKNPKSVKTVKGNRATNNWWDADYDHD